MGIALQLQGIALQLQGIGLQRLETKKNHRTEATVVTVSVLTQKPKTNLTADYADYTDT
jgi:hypothetical protein